jgi:hypothetical protein
MQLAMTPPAAPTNPELWKRARALIDRAPSLDALRAHRLQLLAATLWEADGGSVPAELRLDRRRATAMALASPGLLARVRASYGGRLLLFKGPEVAAVYPDTTARYFHDLDLIADDPKGAQQALLAAGFVEEQFPDGWPGGHHLCPLGWPGIPLGIEVHRTPMVPPWLPPPPTEELFGGAVPSATGVDGVLAPDPAAHALLLAAHAWAHRPFGRVGDLLDIAAILPRERWPEASALARRWGWSELWELTAGTTAALLHGARPPVTARLVGRHLAEVRDLTVAEYHALRLLAPIAAVPRRRAPLVLGDALLQLGRRSPDQPWRAKLTRARGALVHAGTSKASHDLFNNNNNPWSR